MAQHGPRFHAARILTFKPLAGLGLISYSVYLIHEPILRLMVLLARPHISNNTVLFLIASFVFLPLIVVGPSRFFMRLRYATMTFPSAPAPVDSIRWEEGGGGYTLKKLALRRARHSRRLVRR